MSHQYTAEKKVELPEKQHRRHRWIAMATYTVTEGEVLRVHVPGEQVILDETNLWDFQVGCIDCEQPYPIVKDRSCFAPEYQG